MSEMPSHVKGRLLVVDDEASLVTALASTLRDEGYFVVGAMNPTDALAALQKERFDVVLTDLHLPEMDGIAFLRAALAIDPTLSGIVMTGHGSIDTAVDAMKVGAIDYVQKPFKLKSVLTVLARALAVRQLRRENEALQRQLVARTKELEATNQELEAFSYSVSHDLRAPLRTIEGFTTALVDESVHGPSKQLEDYGERIQRGVRRMGAMIDDLLRLARAARSDFEWAEVNLGALAQEALEKLRREAPQRQGELVVTGDLAVKGDPGLLRLAMENLVGNAWKYSAQRDVARIEVGVQSGSEGRVFFVRDNGVGFDMGEAKRLFVAFQRLKSGGDFEGTGVGLATVQRIVHRHGGKIWADSELGRGATFFFTLGAPTSDPNLPPDRVR